MLKLDFSIVSVDARNTYVNRFFEENPNYKPSAHELDTITNYILYGKDPYINKKGEFDPELSEDKWTNMTARKEIEIPTKYGTWKRKEPASLDEMMESPTFNESSIVINPVITKTPKVTIDREKEADIPSMKELWQAIDHYAEKLKDPNLSKAQRYQMRHMLIELRRQQFTLKDIFKPAYQKSTGANHLSYLSRECEDGYDWEASDSPFGCAPMGLYHKGDARFEEPLSLSEEKDDWGYNLRAKTIIDFRNPEHIDKIICIYEEMETYCIDNFMSSQKYILETLNYYIDNTKLTDPQLLILKCKIARMGNRAIAELVNKKYNKTYNINYISTIYRKVCAHISETAERIYNYYLERINPYAFKKCSCCGQMKLRNADEFMRKSRNSDGFSSKCKECEKSGTKRTKAE